VPGRRHFATERAKHTADAPRRFAALHHLLITQLPLQDRALIGHASILSYLHQLGIRRLRGGPLTWRIVNRWRHTDALPVLKGYSDRRCARSPVTTSHALTAWLLTRFTSADLFAWVDSAQAVPTAGSFHAQAEAQSSSRSAA
jgi:hypothetical protein